MSGSRGIPMVTIDALWGILFKRSPLMARTGAVGINIVRA